MVNNFKCLKLPSPPENMIKISHTPWDTYVQAFPVVDHVYYVSGNNWVASYLIDTGDGLILIDTGIQENLYLMVNEIYGLGYRPAQIRKILLSHAHIDHIGGARAMKELTDAEVYLGKRDLFFLTERRDLILGPEYLCGEFLPDKFYEDEPVITLGNITIKAIPSPGHTPGCHSFVFDITAKNGDIHTCAMMGGLGIFNLTTEELEANGLPLTLRQEYIASLEELIKIPVDIVLPSHPDQYDILEQVGKRKDDTEPLVSPNVWAPMLEARLAQAKRM